MFTFLCFVDDYRFGIMDVLMHVAYLPWFDKLPNFGHLYFMTMIAICYMVSFILTRIGVPNNGGVALCISAACVFVADCVIESKGLPGYIFMWWWFFLLSFVYAPKIISWSISCKKSILVSSVIMLNLLAICLFYSGLYDNYNHALSKWLGAICSMSVLFLGLNIWYKAKERKIVGFVATISFEIYLMFNIISEGKFSIMGYIENPLIAFCIYIALSVLMGYALHLIVICINIAKNRFVNSLSKDESLC